VPLLIEVKDQDGRMGPDVGALEQAVAIDLARYDGPVAVMSFNPHSVDALRHYAPLVPRGLTTCSWRPEDWPDVPADLRAACAASPTSRAPARLHQPRGARPRPAARRRAEGGGRAGPLLDDPRPEAEAEARKIADNVTFEGYRRRPAPA
jgi:glycerophosphoryl diester phosphodiesterase